MADYKPTINGRMMELEKKAVAFDDIFNMDTADIISCPICHKKWIEMEDGPGEYYIIDKDLNVARDYGYENKKGFFEMRMHVCTCNFPLVVYASPDEDLKAGCDAFEWKGNSIEKI